jgi:hypothetical protein
MKSIFTLFVCITLISSVKAQSQANAGPDRSKCQKDTLRIEGFGLLQNDTGYYQWTKLSNHSIISNSEVLNLTLNFVGMDSFELQLMNLKNGITIFTKDTMYVRSHQLPVFMNKGLTPMCYNDCSKKLSANQCVIAKLESGAQTSDVRYYDHYSPTRIEQSGGNSYVFNLCKFFNNSQIPKTGLLNEICVDYTDSNGCYDSACFNVKLYPSIVVELKDINEPFLGDSINLETMIVKPFSRTGTIQNFRCIDYPSTLSINPSDLIVNMGFGTFYFVYPSSICNLNKIGSYVLEYSIKDALTGCTTLDTAVLQIMNPCPPFIKNDVRLCQNDNLFDLDILLNGCKSDVFKGKWEILSYNDAYDTLNAISKKAILNSIVSKDQFVPSINGKYELKYTDYCGLSDSKYFFIDSMINLNIYFSDTICETSNFALDCDLCSQFNIEWSGPGVSNGILNTSFTDRSKKFDGPFKYIAKIKNEDNACQVMDSAWVTVVHLPKYKVNFKTYKILGKYFADLEIENISNLDTSFDQIQWQFDNGTTSNFYKNEKIEYPDSGDYNIAFKIITWNCLTSDSFDVQFDWKTLTAAQILHPSMMVYPQPVNETLNIEIVEESDVKLYDVSGQLIYSNEKIRPGVLKIDVAMLQSGVYLLQINQSVIKIIKI